MNFDDARVFLYRVMPWAPLGDPSAYVNVHWTFTVPDQSRPVWGGRACLSIDEIVNNIQWAAKQPNTQSFYACMSTQRIAKEKAVKGGRVMRQAQRSQDNVVQLRAFFADIDLKTDDTHLGAAYTTKDELARAFAKFLNDSGLPKPSMIVDTGTGGMHVYWLTYEALKPSEWQPLANAFAEAMRRHGLKADTGCTVDSARVMRIPGTKHPKTGKLARIVYQTDDYPVAALRAALAPYMGAKVIELRPRIAENDELSSGISPEARPVNLPSIAARGCGFLATALDTGGRDYAQPLWNLTTLCAVFAENGRDMAHAMSKGYAGYSQAETDELFDRKVREREERNIGWPTCDAIENAGCSSCSGCALRKPGSRPLQFAVAPQSQSTIVGGGISSGDLPPGYFRTSDNIIKRSVSAGKDGDKSKVVEVSQPYPVLGGWVQKTPYTLYFDTIINVGDKPTTIAMPFTIGATTDAFTKFMADKGLAFYGDQRKQMQDFVMSYAAKLQQIFGKSKEAKPFGWVYADGKIIGFAYNNTLFKTDGTKEPSAVPALAIIEPFTPKGELKPWLTATKPILALKSPERNAILAAAFAGPLVHFTSKRGLLMAVYGESGSFKTTCMQLGQSVWGQENARFGVSDTNNSTLGTIGTLNSLPVFWDEIKGDQNTENFVALTFEVTKGREKRRMSSDTSIRTSGEWDTALISATNDSLVDPVRRYTKSTTAGLHRLFEWEVPKVAANLPQHVMDTAIRHLRTNYGRAGEKYAEWLAQNVKRIETDLGNVTDRLAKILNAQPDERFWLASVAILVLGARYANELQLLNVDEAQLEEFLKGRFLKMRSIVTGSEVDLTQPKALAGILAQFMAYVKPRHYLETDRVHMGRGRPPANTSPVGSIHSDMQKIDAVFVHWARQSGVVRISATVFREWLRRNNYSVHLVVENLQQRVSMREARGILGAGTPAATKFHEMLFELDLTDQELRDVIEMTQ